PNAGSDLAAVRTRAELRGDAFHVSGQKIWTSYARFAEWCILVTRTDFQAPKHKGITFLLVDMTSPGITIRPLVEMTGVAWFNEVFFDDVRVPRENVVGEVNGGWTIVITTLAHERSGSAPHARIQGEMREILDLARRVGRDGQPAAADPRARQRLAQSFIETEILRGLAYKNVSEIMRNGQPGPEGSCLKLVWSEVDQRMKDLALDMQGPYGDLERGAPRAIDGGRWQYEYLWSRAASIYAGTSEVQRNIIAQRVLGLPRAARTPRTDIRPVPREPDGHHARRPRARALRPGLRLRRAAHRAVPLAEGADRPRLLCAVREGGGARRRLPGAGRPYRAALPL